MADALVYTGFWINYAKGAIPGATLTITHQNGFYLVSFLTLFVRYTGGHMWDIICFIVYQIRHTRELKDGLWHQQQVLIRNSHSPLDTLWDFTKLSFFWRGHAKAPVWRNAPYMLVIIIHASLFLAAAFFSSSIASTSDDVLIRSNANCGYLPFPDSKTFTKADAITSQNSWVNMRAAAMWAQSYTRECYIDNADSSTCNTFTKRNIDVKLSQTTCPFPNNPNICLDPKQAIQADTGYINSALDLGINSPLEVSVDYRKVTTCSPILTSRKYWTQVNSTDLPGDIVRSYHYGNTTSGDNTTFYFDLFEWTESKKAYFLYAQFAAASGLNYSTFVPIQELNRTDADVTLVMLLNFAKYLDPVPDLWFNATKPNNVTASVNKVQTYSSTLPVGVMGCTEQHQLCHHSTGICTALMGIAQLAQVTSFSGAERTISRHMFPAIENNNVELMVASLGSSALLADSLTIAGQSLTSQTLPVNQWQREVQFWANFSVSHIQRMVYEQAAGSSYLTSDGNKLLTPTAEDQANFDVCSAQKIHDSHFYSFSVVGMSITIGIGVIIILLNLCLPTFVVWIQRKSGRGVARAEDWILDDILQVQRMAFENAGMGVWTNKHGHVPVTLKGEKLGRSSRNLSMIFNPNSPFEQQSPQTPYDARSMRSSRSYGRDSFIPGPSGAVYGPVPTNPPPFHNSEYDPFLAYKGGAYAMTGEEMRNMGY